MDAPLVLLRAWHALQGGRDGRLGRVGVLLSCAGWRVVAGRPATAVVDNT